MTGSMKTFMRKSWAKNLGNGKVLSENFWRLILRNWYVYVWIMHIKHGISSVRKFRMVFLFGSEEKVAKQYEFFEKNILPS